VLLDDPRLTNAKALEHDKNYVDAAKAVHALRPADDPCAWDYLEGRLLVAGNATADAIPAFERASAAGCPLAGYATLRAAQQIARSGRPDDAIARAKVVPVDHTLLVDEVKMVVAESLATKGDKAGALPLWREWLTANPHGSRWVDTSVRIANALLDGVDGAPETRAKEAYDVATRVVLEAPKLAESSGASAARLRAVAAIKPKDPDRAEQLSEAERQKQAQAWLDLGEPSKAWELAPKKMTCKAAITHANAGTKKTPKSDTWPDAIATCEKDSDLVTALYSGAKSRSSKESSKAIEWYGRVESEFPSHRLADDARFRAALLVAQSSEDKAEQMLRSLPDTYPQGDMRTEALFRAALGRMTKGDWATARGDLDRVLAIAPSDARASYFRARAAERLGEPDAKARYAAVIDKHPLTWWMVLAHGQLRSLDGAAANAALDGEIAKDKSDATAFPSPKAQPVLDSAGFRRAVRLLEVGEVDAARAEMKAAGATADSAEPEVVWSVGVIYNEAGFPELGHVFARARLTDHLEHFPEARWRIEWETAYPRAFEPLVAKACEKYTLPQAIAWGIMREESSFVADAKSPAQAYGLMQLIVPTARGLTSGTPYGADEASLKQPEVSIELGTRLLAGLRSKYNHDALAIGAYNAGGGSVDKWMRNRTGDDLDLFVENIPFDETRNYVKRVTSSVAAYGYLYDRKSYDAVLAMPLQVK
jgi:soluble lytic murein transglycosylase